MTRAIKFITPVFLIFLMTSCLRFGTPVPAKSQLEVRQMQTYIFDVKDFKLVMKAMLNVLQDEGFVVKNVHLDLGFLTSTKEVDVESTARKFWAALFSPSDVRWQKTNVIDATANVTEHGSQTKVRVNFQIKQLDNYGNVITVNQVQEDLFYQEFFSKVSKSIFIQEEKL